HGLYSSAFKRVSDRGGIHAFRAMGCCVVPAARVVGGNGCAYAPVLRGRGGASNRAYLCQRSNEPDQEHSVGRSVGGGGAVHATSRVCCASIAGRRIEDHLRSSAVESISACCSAGRAINAVVWTMISVSLLRLPAATYCLCS